MPPRAATVGRYFDVSTDLVAPRERRSFWRDTALNRSDPDFPSDDEPSGFVGGVRGFIGVGSEIREGRSAALILQRSAVRCRRDGGGEVLLSGLVASDGPGHYRQADREFLVPVGRFLFTDMATPFSMDLQRYRSVNFRLSRAAVAGAIDADPSSLAGRLLPATPLVGLLFSQLAQFAEALPVMDDASRQVALEAATDFALAVLRLEVRGGAWDEGAHWSGLWQAAQRFVDSNLDRAELGPEMLARALRCSRTHLYRLFARQDQTVMGYARERRLARSQAMLVDAACRLTIGEIALLCGFDDPSMFSRSFRRRYGCQPGDVRRQARAVPE